MMLAASLLSIALLGAGGVVAGNLIRPDADAGGATAPASSSSSLPSPSASADSSGIGGFSPLVCAGPASAPAPTAPQPGAPGSVNGWNLPPGWSYFSVGTGPHVAVPDGWTYRLIGTTYCLRDPSAERVLSIATSRHTSADPVSTLRNEASRLVNAGALPDYRQIAMERRRLLSEAADWEYTYRDSHGPTLHVLTRWSVVGGKAYAISWSTEDVDWAADAPKFHLVMSMLSSGALASAPHG
jgi:hypothetical protein